MAELKPKEEAKVTRFKFKQDPRPQASRLKERQYAYNEWFAELPPGATIEQVMEPDYWAHLAMLIRPLDTMEVFSEDGTWEALFRVMFVGPNEVKLSTLRVVEHEKVVGTASLSDVYDIIYKSAITKWAVVNKQNGMIIKDKFFPRSEAVAFLRKHLETVKA